MIVATCLPRYQLGDTLEELLAEPDRRTLPPLLDGVHSEAQIEAALPADPFAILRPDFQADFRVKVGNPLRQALLEARTWDHPIITRRMNALTSPGLLINRSSGRDLHGVTAVAARSART